MYLAFVHLVASASTTTSSSSSSSTSLSGIAVAVVITEGVGIIGGLLYVGRWAGRIETGLKSLRELLQARIDGVTRRVVVLEGQDRSARRRTDQSQT